MPTNPRRDDQRCREFLDKILKKLPDCKDGIEIKTLIRNCLIRYPVSERMIVDFIQNYYIDEGLVSLNNGILKSPCAIVDEVSLILNDDKVIANATGQ